MPFRLFLLGLIAWVFLPTATIGGLYLYARLGNAAPHPGALTCGLDANAVFTGDAATYSVIFDGSGRTPGAAPPKPIDLVLAVDISGSIGGALPALTGAVGSAARSLAAAADVRFALVSFDTSAYPVSSWNSDPAVLERGLATLRPGGGTDITPVFPVVEGLRALKRPGARTVLIFFTDGLFDVSASTERTAAALRNADGDIHVVGLPQQPLPETMHLLTGQPGNLFNTASLDDLTRQFQHLRNRIVEGIGFNARLDQTLDPRHFGVPQPSAGWLAADGAMSRFAGTLTPQRQVFSHPVTAGTIGLWRVGSQPARLSFTNPAGQMEEHTCAPRPLLLVLDGWILAIAYTPVGVWCLVGLLAMPRRMPPGSGRKSIGELTLPAPIPLPAPAPPPREPGPAMPTLFIGLGGSGAAALERMMEQVERRDGGRPDLSNTWLLLDVDRVMMKPRSPRAACPPPDLAGLEPLVAAGRMPAHLDWFPVERYRDAAHDQFSVARGSGGDRMLARLAFFRWVAEGDLVHTLRIFLNDLGCIPAPDGVRQVILVAGDAGGFGSAAFADTARLVRRLAPDVGTEVIGVLLRDGAEHEPQRLANREALRRELETTQLAGALWRPWTSYAGRGDPVLDSVDEQSPFNWVFAVDGRNAADTVARSGHLAAVLTDRHPRWTLLAALAADDHPGALPTAVTAVQVRADLLREWLAAELFLRVVASDGLVDLEPAPGGGFQPVTPAPGKALDLLTDWARAAEGPLAWRDLLARAAGTERPQGDGDGDRDGDAPAQHPADRIEWLRRVLAAEVTRRLAGRDNGGGWKRELPAAAAPEVLRRLAERLETLGDGDADAGTALAADARRLAGQFDVWLRTLAGAALGAHERRTAALSRLDEPAVAGEVFLDGSGTADERLVRAAFETWLPGHRDVASALRERLHFAAVRDRGDVALVMRCYIGPPRDHTDPEIAASELARLLRDATALPAELLEGRLVHHLSADGQRLAQRLVQDERPPWISLLVLPETPDDPGALAGFARQVRDPAGHRHRHDVAGNDRGAVRRVAIAVPNGEPADLPALPLVSRAEVTGERLRARLRHRFGRFVPLLPPALRLASADPDGLAAFARAYRRGVVIRIVDAAGQPQWAVAGGGVLTGGAHASLSGAALAFIHECPAVPDAAAGAGAPDLSALEAWFAGQPAAWPDAAAQAVAVLLEEDTP